MSIKAYIDYNERNRDRYYKNFEEIDTLPTLQNLDELIANTELKSSYYNGECIKIEELELDTEQGNDDVYNYNFYKITCVDIAAYHNDNDEDKDINYYISSPSYVCIKKEEVEENKMKKVIILRPNQDLEVVESKLRLEDLQEIVGGYIEIPYIPSLSEKGIDIIINEEGKFDDECIENFALINDNEVIDVIMGNVIFASHDEEGNTIGLNEEQIDFIKNELFDEELVVFFIDKNDEQRTMFGVRL